MIILNHLHTAVVNDHTQSPAYSSCQRSYSITCIQQLSMIILNHLHTAVVNDHTQSPAYSSCQRSYSITCIQQLSMIILNHLHTAVVNDHSVVFNLRVHLRSLLTALQKESVTKLPAQQTATFDLRQERPMRYLDANWATSVLLSRQHVNKQGM